MEKSEYKRLGDYIQQVDVRNKDLAVTELMGINIDKFFMPSVANTIGTDLSNYKVVSNRQFACNLMHVGRDERLPVAMHTGEKRIIVSPAYFVFEIIDENVLDASYLMMWFSRAEFDRNAWFYTDADVRGGLIKSAFLDMELAIPSIDKQREIVRKYETIQKRIKLNENIIEKLEDTAQTLYRKMFVDGIDKENLPEGWRMGTLSELGQIVGGSTPSVDNAEYWGDEIKWITPADLSKQNKKFIYGGVRNITKLGYESTSTKKLPINSVLFSSRAPIGLLGINKVELCTNQGFKSIIPFDEIETYYVYYTLNHHKYKIAGQNIGSTFDEVSSERMKCYEVIIPEHKIIDKFNNFILKIFDVQLILEKEKDILIELSKLHLVNV